MSANALLWADLLADGEGRLQIIGQDATLWQFYWETCDKKQGVRTCRVPYYRLCSTEEKVNLWKYENWLVIPIP